MKKLHYLHLNHEACGRGGFAPALTSNINKVTCNACLNAVAGKKAGGRPKNASGRNKVQIVLSDRALENLAKIKRGKRSQVISDFLEKII